MKQVSRGLPLGACHAAGAQSLTGPRKLRICQGGPQWGNEGTKINDEACHERDFAR